MFDQYMICENSLENIYSSNSISGFQFKARLPYHRRLGLSMYEDLHIKVDGVEIARKNISVTLHGNSYTLDEMETVYEDDWGFGEVGTISVQKPGGLSAGEHKFETRAVLRISYIPVPFTGQDCKYLSLCQ